MARSVAASAAPVSLATRFTLLVVLLLLLCVLEASRQPCRLTGDAHVLPVDVLQPATAPAQELRHPCRLYGCCNDPRR